MVDYQHTSHLQMTKGAVDVQIYSAGCFKLLSTAMWVHERFLRDVQKLFIKVRLLSVALNSFYGDSSSTRIFFKALQIDRT